MFGYEREPETPSHTMTPRVPIHQRRSRRARLLTRQQQLSRERLSRRIGETITVLVDSPADGARGRTPRWAARTSGQAWEVDGGVMVEGEGLAPGQLAKVRVTGAGAYDLFARVDRPADPALTILS